jgi:hypothetical protein
VVKYFFDRKIRFGKYTRTEYAQIIGSLRHFLKIKKGENISDYKL